MESTLEKIGCLNGTILKIIALVSMTVDHIGFILFPEEIWLRVIGRLAFPIFAYMVAEGCKYTKHKTRYISLVFAIAVLVEIFEYIFVKELSLNIMFTLGFSIAIIFALQNALDKKNTVSWILLAAVVICVLFICIGLPEILKDRGFSIDYRIFGVLTPVAVYLVEKRWQKLLVLSVMLAIITVTAPNPILMGTFRVQWFSLIAVLLLALYNGKRGRYSLKYLFYIYYPLHLAILWGIELL